LTVRLEVRVAVPDVIEQLRKTVAQVTALGVQAL
jgi:hypothetical protein